MKISSHCRDASPASARRAALSVAILLAAWPATCGQAPAPGPSVSTAPPPAAAVASPSAAASPETIAQFLERRQSRYRAAVAKVRVWMDGLTVDPIELRRHNVKGKKKLAECLDVYARLLDIASPGEKEALKTAIRDRASITGEARYHDLAGVSDRQFKEDSTSYLRVAFLMDRIGLDTSFYRGEIRKILPRLNAHMPTRGTDQRMAFHLYYRHFGLDEPFPLESAFQAGIIVSRRPASGFANRMDVYSLTHEVFVPYQFGDKLDAEFFSAEDKAYLRGVLAALTAAYIESNDPDVAAELSSCLSYLRFTDLPVYRRVLDYLLDCQRADGAWGDYERYRPFYGDYVNQGFYLHTTLVALDALTAAFAKMGVDASRPAP